MTTTITLYRAEFYSNTAVREFHEWFDTFEAASARRIPQVRTGGCLVPKRISAVEIPTDRAGLLAWLNENYVVEP